MILTNGDFYPRNLIELPSGKIAIVDWEGRQDYDFVDHGRDLAQKVVDQRNAFVNFIENHIAFFYIHMWGKPRFPEEIYTWRFSKIWFDCRKFTGSYFNKIFRTSFDLARRFGTFAGGDFC